MNKTLALINLTKSLVGIDVTPENLADNEVACAESVSKILHLLLNFPVGILSTLELKKELDKSKLFEQVDKPKAGCIVISPRTKTTTGHCEIYITDNKTAGNNSKTGKIEQNYTTASWKKTFEVGRGLLTFYYKLK